jgi:hypothetical protein
MILPDLVLSSRQNQIWPESGMDSLEFSKHKQHFKSYPYQVEYRYNSRGFRDAEWPEDINELKNAIWCVGDSFTVGLGAPVEHSWPCILQKRLGIRTINVSMDGASNTWISRKSKDILQIINPKTLIIHWSYLNRREISDDEIWNKHADQSIQEIYSMFRESDWPTCNTMQEFKNLPTHIQEKILPRWSKPYYTDEERRLTDMESSLEQDLQNLVSCITDTIKNNKNSRIVHSFIPEFAQHTKSQDLQMILNQVSLDLDIEVIKYFSKLDLARDYHHYDVITANYFVDQLIELLSQ